MPGRDKSKLMKLQMHKTLGCSSPRPKKSCLCDLGNWAVLCPSCSNWRDTLRLKICGMLRRLISSDGKEERHYKVKSASTSFEKNNSTRRQENVMLPSYSLWIEERGKNTRHNKTWVNASDTAFRRNHEPQMRMGNKSFLADFLTEKANCPESITL